MTDTASKPATTRNAQKTEYVILEEIGAATPNTANSAIGWRKAATISAASTEAAIRKHAESKKEKSGRYIAIPARSWKPVTVAAETKTILKLT